MSSDYCISSYSYWLSECDEIVSTVSTMPSADAQMFICLTISCNLCCCSGSFTMVVTRKRVYQSSGVLFLCLFFCCSWTKSVHHKHQWQPHFLKRRLSLITLKSEIILKKTKHFKSHLRASDLCIVKTKALQSALPVNQVQDISPFTIITIDLHLSADSLQARMFFVMQPAVGLLCSFQPRLSDADTKSRRGRPMFTSFE